MGITGIIIPAGGVGTRMGMAAGGAAKRGAENLKQFMLLAGRPVLARVVETFARALPEAEIVVALPEGHTEEWASLCRLYEVPPHKVCVGGASRTASVRSALEVLSPECELIAVHDAARPVVSAPLIHRTIATARKLGSAIPVIPLTDSLRRVYAGRSRPEDRDRLRAVQTPQVFHAEVLRDAFAKTDDGDFTDEATLVEAAGYQVTLCDGDPRNIKITHPADLIIAEQLLNS